MKNSNMVLQPSCSEYVDPVKVTKKEREWLLKMVKQFKEMEKKEDIKEALEYFLIYPERTSRWKYDGDQFWFISKEGEEVYKQLNLLLKIKRGEMKL